MKNPGRIKDSLGAAPAGVGEGGGGGQVGSDLVGAPFEIAVRFFNEVTEAGFAAVRPDDDVAGLSFNKGNLTGGELGQTGVQTKAGEAIEHCPSAWVVGKLDGE